MTPHSIVRSLPLLGWKVTATSKGAWDVRTIDAERPDALVSPYGRPGPEQRRDLIGARL